MQPMGVGLYLALQIDNYYEIFLLFFLKLFIIAHEIKDKLLRFSTSDFWALVCDV